MEQSHPVLGQSPGPDDKRDAIHIAIAPVVAAHTLGPGQHVGPYNDGRYGITATPIGIVDPFLIAAVAENSPFWLCLYPYSITSLRHVWTHPSFVAKPPAAAADLLGALRETVRE
jgi:hypothetical protein